MNVYNDANAYFTPYQWMQIERPSARGIDGAPRFTVKQANDWERVIGPNTRSTGQWAAWESTWSPVGADGYPARIWDPTSGKINHDVAAYWKASYDINQKLQANWATLGPKVQGQLHFAVGDADTYFLNESVHLLETSMLKMTNPPANFSFEYGARRPHRGPDAAAVLPGVDSSRGEHDCATCAGRRADGVEQRGGSRGDGGARDGARGRSRDGRGGRAVASRQLAEPCEFM